MTTVDEILAHHGVKGMQWGVRKRRDAKAAEIRRTISPESKAAALAFGKAKTTGVHSLTNKELQDFVTRANLERQYSAVAPTPLGRKLLNSGGKFAADVLLGVGKAQATKLVNDRASILVSKAIKK